MIVRDTFTVTCLKYRRGNYVPLIANNIYSFDLSNEAFYTKFGIGRFDINQIEYIDDRNIRLQLPAMEEWNKCTHLVILNQRTKVSKSYQITDIEHITGNVAKYSATLWFFDQIKNKGDYDKIGTQIITGATMQERDLSQNNKMINKMLMNDVDASIIDEVIELEPPDVRTLFGKPHNIFCVMIWHTNGTFKGYKSPSDDDYNQPDPENAQGIFCTMVPIIINELGDEVWSVDKSQNKIRVESSTTVSAGFNMRPLNQVIGDLAGSIIGVFVTQDKSITGNFPIIEHKDSEGKVNALFYDWYGTRDSNFCSVAMYGNDELAFCARFYHNEMFDKWAFKDFNNIPQREKTLFGRTELWTSSAKTMIPQTTGATIVLTRIYTPTGTLWQFNDIINGVQRQNILGDILASVPSNYIYAESPLNNKDAIAQKRNIMINTIGSAVGGVVSTASSLLSGNIAGGISSGIGVVTGALQGANNYSQAVMHQQIYKANSVSDGVYFTWAYEENRFTQPAKIIHYVCDPATLQFKNLTNQYTGIMGNYSLPTALYGDGFFETPAICIRGEKTTNIGFIDDINAYDAFIEAFQSGIVIEQIKP